MKRLGDALRYRVGGAPPRSARVLVGRMAHAPRESMAALLRCAGPFVPERDAWRFTNSWVFTPADIEQLRRRLEHFIDPVASLGEDSVHRALLSLTFDVAGVALSLPAAVIERVARAAGINLRNDLNRLVADALPGPYGRCGGMAFSAYDLFLAGHAMPEIAVRPPDGPIREYIWMRLLDSLELNATRFLEAMMVLHVMPVVSKAASGALGAVAGAIAGPLGMAVGAYVAGKEDVLGLGGSRALAAASKGDWARLRQRLDEEAAWPLGLVYLDKGSPIDQHQVLATRYRDVAANRVELEIWDNNHGAAAQCISIDFGDEALQARQIAGVAAEQDLGLAALVCEDYRFHAPPNNL